MVKITQPSGLAAWNVILNAMPEGEWCPAAWLADVAWDKKVTWSARSGQWQKMGVMLWKLHQAGWVHHKKAASGQNLWRRAKPPMQQ